MKREFFLDIILPICATVISIVALVLGRYDSYISNRVSKKVLQAEKEYNDQSEQLLLSTINYSLGTNEILIAKLLNSNPVKTFEQYYVEYDTAKTNYSIVEKIDLSKLTEVNMGNIQGYMYFYPRYLSNMKESLNRLKNRSDVLKNMMNEGAKIRVNGESLDGKSIEEIKKEMLVSEYKVDWIIVENDSKIVQSFIQFLIDSRGMLQQLKNGVENKELAVGVNPEKTYEEMLEKNEKIIKYDDVPIE